MHIAEQQRGWKPEYTQSVAATIREGMDTSNKTRPRPTVDSPRDLPAPQAHLPLRKASAQRLQSRKGSVPRPLFVPTQQHQLRGFNPSSVQPSPQINNVTASSEHAFAGREPHRPFKPPLGVRHSPRGSQYPDPYSSYSPYPDRDGRPPSSPLLPPHPDSPRENARKLKSSKSAGDGFRGLRHHMSDRHMGSNNRKTSEPAIHRPHTATHEVRESFRSGATGHSSLANASSVNTERSSLTANSSHSELIKNKAEEWLGEEEEDEQDEVDDVLDMYEDGFESGKQSLDVRSIRSTERPGRSLEVPQAQAFDRPTSQPSSQQKQQLMRPHAFHRRSQSASILLGAAKYSQPGGSLAPPEPSPTEPRSSLQITPMAQSQSPSPARSANASPPQHDGPVPRDRYGFKKASHYITVEQYDAWNITYSEHIERRTRKWHSLMRSYGLSTVDPFRFPPKSDKIKRYVRKGIPPNFRGAAWFWYAGGPGKLAKEPGLYRQLIEKVDKGDLSETDREHIERDLNRTFPDNIRFKPDPTTTLDAQAGAGGGDGNVEAGKNKNRRVTIEEPETPTLQSLRRVLQTFAVHNPNVGYCQSLNFIAGLLLIFLEGDEEKAFILLNIVTSLHLPGTHGVALEGANIDIAVLMSCIKDSLPGIWNKLDDKGGSNGVGGIMSNVGGGGALRLPTVSLATTAWFMSLFVGTLPIESVLRVWDCLFFEGSKTLFRIALAIFKFGEPQILQVSDPMEIFQVVQTIPRSMLDINGLLEVCFRRRGGFGGVSQGLIEARREEKRRVVKEGLSDALADESAFRRLRGRFRSRTAK